MPGFDPAIHPSIQSFVRWMRGSSPRMTVAGTETTTGAAGSAGFLFPGLDAACEQLKEQNFTL
jgi:hypothetical protein